MWRLHLKSFWLGVVGSLLVSLDHSVVMSTPNIGLMLTTNTLPGYLKTSQKFSR